MRVVIRLSPLAQVGVMITVLGVILGLYGRFAEREWARAPSIVLVLVGALVYLLARLRMITKVPKD